MTMVLGGGGSSCWHTHKQCTIKQNFVACTEREPQRACVHYANKVKTEMENVVIYAFYLSTRCSEIGSFQVRQIMWKSDGAHCKRLKRLNENLCLLVYKSYSLVETGAARAETSPSLSFHLIRYSCRFTRIQRRRRFSIVDFTLQNK